MGSVKARTTVLPLHNLHVFISLIVRERAMKTFLQKPVGRERSGLALHGEGPSQKHD